MLEGVRGGGVDVLVSVLWLGPSNLGCLRLFLSLTILLAALGSRGLAQIRIGAVIRGGRVAGLRRRALSRRHARFGACCQACHVLIVAQAVAEAFALRRGGVPVVIWVILILLLGGDKRAMGAEVLVLEPVVAALAGPGLNIRWP